MSPERPPNPGIVIWGAGSHARVVADAIRLRDDFEIAGFLDDVSPDRRGGSFCGSLVLGGNECLTDLREQGVEHAIVAIGDCDARLALSQRLLETGFHLPVVAHPGACVSPSARAGAGTFLAAGAVVGPDAHLGQAVLVNTCASIDHDCRVDDGVHVGPGVCLTGGILVGAGTFLGAGAVVVPGVVIGAGSIIGAGSLVLHDVPDGVIAYGRPASIIRERRDDE